MFSGRVREQSLPNKELWRETLNALEKSREMTCTKSSLARQDVILWIREVMAAVVEPVGLKANWLDGVEERGGHRKRG